MSFPWDQKSYKALAKSALEKKFLYFSIENIISGPWLYCFKVMVIFCDKNHKIQKKNYSNGFKNTMNQRTDDVRIR